MELLNKAPSLLVGNELTEALTIRPVYNSDIRYASQSERLSALNNIFDIYYPSFMACEIYSKLYLAYIRALNKKNNTVAIKQYYDNKNGIANKSYQGIIGGSDSFTIIGSSGIGKSSAISRAISVISKDSILFINSTKIIPFLIVQTPCDSSLKGLLLEILRSIDSILGTKYYQDAMRVRATLDMLIGSVSQVCLNHVCVLIIDEAQNVVTAKNGKNLVNALVQLINNSGISLCFVGTPECNVFFESAFQLARRSVGLYYSSLPYDDYFFSLCQILFSYQYTKHTSALTKDIVEWLYLHSNGITAVVVGLIESAQEIAILNGTEKICIETLNEAYKRRFGMLHSYINNDSLTVTRTVKEHPSIKLKEEVSLSKGRLLKILISEAKKKELYIVDYLKQYITVEEITV